VTVSEHAQERLQALESELSNTKTELARVAREQALAAESLRASEELKSRLIACSRDCIKILDLEGRLLFMNEGGMQVLEICDIGPFLNGPWVEFWEGADREAAKREDRSAAARRALRPRQAPSSSPQRPAPPCRSRRFGTDPLVGAGGTPPGRRLLSPRRSPARLRCRRTSGSAGRKTGREQGRESGEVIYKKVR